MVRLARGLGIAGAAVLLAIPFIASAQEDEAVDGAVVVDQDADVTAPTDVEDARPDGAGPPWWTGEPRSGEGRPPWAGQRGGPGGGPPPWAGSDAGDRPDGAGPPWYDGPAHTGQGPPPWAGGPGQAGPGGSGEDWSPGAGRPPWAGGDDD